MLLSARDLVIKSIDLYKKNIKLFLIYAVLLYAPSAAALLIAALLNAIRIAITMANGSQTIGAAGMITMGVITVLIFIFAALISFWFSLAFIRTIAKSYQGLQSEPVKQEIMGSKRLVWPAILASILSGLAVMGGIILFIIPGIIFSIWFAFILQTVVLDEKKGIKALAASKCLVKGRWFQVLWKLFVPGAIYLIISQGIEIPLGLIGDISGSSIIYWIAVSLSFLVGLALMPFITSAQTILYLELKKVPAQKNKKEKAPLK